jgi:hypothetical protein
VTGSQRIVVAYRGQRLMALGERAQARTFLNGNDVPPLSLLAGNANLTCSVLFLVEEISIGILRPAVTTVRKPLRRSEG